MRFKLYQILDFNLPSGGEYMILESLKSAPAKVIHIFDLSDCDGKLQPFKHVESGEMIYPSKNEFKIGRSVESDMKIADISVSRVHSFIRFEGRELIIEDNGSKFGTMVRIDKPTKLLDTHFSKIPNKPMQNPFTLQMENSVNSSIY